MDSAGNLDTMTPMRAVFAQRKTQFIAALVVAIALVIARSIVWILFEQSHFDSDQAAVGLMAKQLAEGRAFPLFFYGQHYMLAVEAWLVAPVFRVAGASILTLKLPLLCLNIVTCALLLWVLVRKMGLTPFEALLTSIFFIVPPPLVSARLVEAQGSNIEPFLYVLILWFLRNRPIAFGPFGGFAFLHREFAAYAIAAIVLVDVLMRRAFTRERLREYVMSWGMFALVNVVVSLLKTKADLLGPGTAGRLNLGGLDAQVSSWGGFVCWPPSELTANLSWLRHENLGNDVQLQAGSARSGRLDTDAGGLQLAGLRAAGGGGCRDRRSCAASPAYRIELAIRGVSDGGGRRSGLLLRSSRLSREGSHAHPLHAAYAVLPNWPPRSVSQREASCLVARAGARRCRTVGRLLAGRQREIHRRVSSSAADVARARFGQLPRIAGRALRPRHLLDCVSARLSVQGTVDIFLTRKGSRRRVPKIADEHDQQTVHIRPNRGWPNRPCEVGITFRLWCLEYFDRATNVPR